MYVTRMGPSVVFFFFGIHFRACWGTEPYVALHYVTARVFPVGPPPFRSIYVVLKWPRPTGGFSWVLVLVDCSGTLLLRNSLQ